MPFAGTYRLRARKKVVRKPSSGEAPAAATFGETVPDAERDSVFRTLYSLIPTEAYLLYESLANSFSAAIESSAALGSAIAWCGLVVTMALRFFGSMPPGEIDAGKAQYIVIIISMIAYTLLVLLDGGAFWPSAGAVSEDAKPFVGVIGAGFAAVATAYMNQRTKDGDSA